VLASAYDDTQYEADGILGAGKKGHTTKIANRPTVCEGGYTTKGKSSGGSVVTT